MHAAVPLFRRLLPLGADSRFDGYVGAAGDIGAAAAAAAEDEAAGGGIEAVHAVAAAGGGIEAVHAVGVLVVVAAAAAGGLAGARDAVALALSFPSLFRLSFPPPPSSCPSPSSHFLETRSVPPRHRRFPVCISQLLQPQTDGSRGGTTTMTHPPFFTLPSG